MIFFAMILMALTDILATLLVVAEAKGRIWLAGALDAAKDWPNFLLAGISGATLTKHGFGSEFILVSGISVTSFFSSALGTAWSRKIEASRTD